MRVVRAFVYGAMALMLAAGWGFLYWQSGTIDLAAGNAARAALADLRAIDARWDDQVTAMGLATRSGPPPAPVAHQAALASLEAQALRLAHPDLGRALGAVRQAFDEKASLVLFQLLKVSETSCTTPTIPLTSMHAAFTHDDWGAVG